MVAGIYHLIMPDQESSDKKMVLSVTEEVKRYDGMAFAGESPRKIFEAARLDGYGIWIAATRSKYQIGPEGNADFKKIDSDYRDAITDLPMNRIVGIFICLVAWLVPMAIFYAFGYVLDWIKRGVRGI